MFGDQGSVSATAVAMVHLDVIGWDDADNDTYDEISRDIELYVVGAFSLGLHRREIERDLQEQFSRVLGDLTFEIVTTRGGEVKAIVSADAVDYA